MSVLPFSFTDILKQNYLYLILLFLVLFVTATLKSAWFKGVMGELFVKFLAKLFLPKTEYHAVNNITLPTKDGTTQIDHVYFSPFGVFVIETKHMKGWIYGSESQRQWVQKFPKSKYMFQNPVHQNAKHVRVIAKLLGVRLDDVHNIVAFTGEAKLKGKMPGNVFKGFGFVSYIKRFKQQVFSAEQVEFFYNKVLREQLPKNYKTKKQHVRNLKKRHRK